MYLGNQPALSYTSFAKQDFTTSATTAYTLSQPVTNENEIALFINFVRQEPTTAYTASGTSLTLTSATSASDDMYAIFLGKAVQTVNPPAGSVGASQIADGSIALGKLSATGTKDSTTFLRGDNTFATPAGGGKLLQVVTATSTASFDTTSSSYVATPLTASITPSSSSSKILTLVNGNLVSNSSSVYATIYRNSTELASPALQGVGAENTHICSNMIILDSPLTTSATSYTVYVKATGGATARWNISSIVVTITLMEIAG